MENWVDEKTPWRTHDTTGLLEFLPWTDDRVREVLSLDQTDCVDGVDCRQPLGHRPCRRWFTSRCPDLKNKQLVRFIRGELDLI